MTSSDRNAALIRERDARRCDACGLVSRGWATIALMRDGRLASSFVLCLACASDAEDAVRQARR